jgi:hypothetical protein
MPIEWYDTLQNSDARLLLFKLFVDLAALETRKKYFFETTDLHWKIHHVPTNSKLITCIILGEIK